jgi:hypothetical protein
VSDVRCASVLVCALLVCVMGCDGAPKLYPVSGTITYKGKPVEGATVVLVPNENEADEAVQVGTAKTDASGKYTITTGGKPGAMGGKYLVTVSKTAKNPAMASMPANPTPEDMRKMAEKRLPPPKSELPSKYSIPQSNLLPITIPNSDPKVFDFDLKD